MRAANPKDTLLVLQSASSLRMKLQHPYNVLQSHNPVYGLTVPINLFSQNLIEDLGEAAPKCFSCLLWTQRGDFSFPCRLTRIPAMVVARSISLLFGSQPRTSNFSCLPCTQRGEVLMLTASNGITAMVVPQGISLLS